MGIICSKTRKLKPESSEKGKRKIETDGEANKISKSFKQFDIVSDSSDHHFFQKKICSSRSWAKSVQKEWRILEKDLPDTIFVRAYEDRMDLLRAGIVGPDGTPYHDGLFFFDIHFPSNYPNHPPLVIYHSGGLRINPNLYADGYVCLSLLNTWYGRRSEKWNPSSSTMLQVLISLQALVLNAKPYFNEPGYEWSANTSSGEKNSLVYNKETFLLSCRNMVYTLRKPPKHFEEFVADHFRSRGPAILAACEAYIAGARVGCPVHPTRRKKSATTAFKSSLKTLSQELVREFLAKGADCRGYHP